MTNIKNIIDGRGLVEVPDTAVSSGSLAVNVPMVASQTVSISLDEMVSGSLTVAGTASLQGTTVNGSANMNGTLTVALGTTLQGNLTTLSSSNVSRDLGNSGFMPFQLSLQTVTGSKTLDNSYAGVTALSSSVGAVITASMPLAASEVGAVYTFRNMNVGIVHVLTGSLELTGSQVFAQGGTVGSKLVLSGAVGSSVSLLCDGASYLVIGTKNTITISGT